MNAPKLLVASILAASLTANAEMNVEAGPVDLSLDISGSVDKIENEEWAADDLFIKLDAKVSERIGLFVEHGIVREALEDLEADGSDMDTRQAYVYVNVGKLNHLGEIELRVGRQELAFGGDVTGNVIPETSYSEESREFIRQRDAVTVMISRDSAEGMGIMSLLNNLVSSVEISHHQDEEDGLDSGYAVRVNGHVGEWVDTSFSYLSDDNDTEATDVQATVHLEKLINSPVLSGLSFTQAFTNYDFGDMEEDIERSTIAKSFGKDGRNRLYYEIENKEVSGMTVEGSEYKNKTIGYERQVSKRFALGVQLQDSEELDEVIGGITVRYNH